jgi:hypothetical protein
MWDFSIARTLAIMAQTLPYVLLRVVIYFAITFAYIIAMGVGAGIGYALGLAGSDEFQGQATFVGGILGFGLVGGAVYFLREYLLYMVKAGHIAVMTELLSGQGIPGGQSQISYGAKIVKERFVEANALFVLDQLIKVVVRAITGILGTISAILPIPALQGFMRFISTIIRPWVTSRAGLILYAQNGWVMVRNAIWLAIISWIVTIIIFLFMIAPAGAILYYFPGDWGGYGFVAAIIFAWAFRSALLEPFGIACLMQVYFKTIEGQTPDPEWESRLTQVSDKFRKLTERAGPAMGMASPHAATSGA